MVLKFAYRCPPAKTWKYQEEKMTREEYLRNLAIFYSGELDKPFRLYNPQEADLAKICPHIRRGNEFKRLIRQMNKHMVFVTAPPVLSANCFHLLALYPASMDNQDGRQQPYLKLVNVIQRDGGKIPFWADRYLFEEYATQFARQNWGHMLNQNGGISEEQNFLLAEAKNPRAA